MRSVVLASRLVHAGIATSIASERVCIDPRTLLRLPIGLCLQILDCRFSLVRGQLLLQAFLGFIEAGVAVNFFGAAQQTDPSPRNRMKVVILGIDPKLSADIAPK